MANLKKKKRCCICTQYHKNICVTCERCLNIFDPMPTKLSICHKHCELCGEVQYFSMKSTCKECVQLRYIRKLIFSNIDLILKFRAEFGLEGYVSSLRKFIHHDYSLNFSSGLYTFHVKDEYLMYPESSIFTHPDLLSKYEIRKIRELKLSLDDVVQDRSKILYSLISCFKFWTNKDIPVLCLEGIFENFYPTDIFS